MKDAIHIPNNSARLKFPHCAIVKAPGLLPMLYSINELCSELDVPRHMVISWLQNGLPHERDRRKYIWVNGKKCSSWIEAVRKAQKKTKTLKPNQAYCFRCRMPVKIINPKVVHENGNRRLTGECPRCCGIVNKGVKSGQQKELQANTRIPSIQKRNHAAQSGINSSIQN